MAELSAVRPREPLEPYDYSILILGASGNGKSTLVNTLVNVVMGNGPGNLQAAVACKTYPNIIPELDDGLHERNDATDGKSQTTYAHFYKLKSSITDNKTILIVDTPGLASTGGVSEDDDNVQIIIESAQRTKNFNAIIVVEKSSTNRLNPCIEYNLYRISEIIPNDFESKVILALTFNMGTSSFEDRWFPFPIQHKLKINNVAFGYSASDYQAKPANLKKVGWDKSIEKIKKFFTKLFTMQKVPTIQYTNLFDHHNTMMNKIADFKSYIDNIEKCKDFIKNPKPGGKMTLNTWTRTEYHSTVCSEHRTLCHEQCFLSYNDSMGTSFFNNCACMNPQKICKICGCASEQHVHKHEKPMLEMATIDQMLDSCSIGDRSTPENILRALEDKEKKLIMDLVEVESNINNISPKYKISKYLQKAVEHIKYQIESEKDPDKLKELLNTKSLYERLSKGMQS